MFCFATRWLGARYAECVYRRHVGLNVIAVELDWATGAIGCGQKWEVAILLSSKHAGIGFVACVG